MAQISVGPLEFRVYSGSNWSSLELAWVTARTHGQAQRETALRASFKSEHLLEFTGTPNPRDTITVDGTTYQGRSASGHGGNDHVLTASQVAARALRNEAIRHRVEQVNRTANAAATGNAPPAAPAADPANGPASSQAGDGDSPWCHI